MGSTKGTKDTKVDDIFVNLVSFVDGMMGSTKGTKV